MLPAHGEQALDGQHIAEDGARLETLGEIPGLVEMGPAFIVPPGRGFEAREADQAVGPAALCTGLVREADRLGGVGVSAQPAAGAKLQLRQDGQRVREEGGGAGGPQLSDFGFERAERRFEVFGADLAERAIAGRHGIGNVGVRCGKLREELAESRSSRCGFAVEEERLGQADLRSCDGHRVSCPARHFERAFRCALAFEDFTGHETRTRRMNQEERGPFWIDLRDPIRLSDDCPLDFHGIRHPDGDLTAM